MGPPAAGGSPLAPLFAAASLGAVFLEPNLPLNLEFVDMVLLPLGAIGVQQLFVRPGYASTLLRSSLPWLWAICAGVTLSLFGVGFALWALGTTVRDFAGFALFFALLAIFVSDARSLRWATGGYVAAVPVVALSVLADGSPRPSGVFSNPNYAGNFLVLGLVIMFTAAKPRWWSWPIAALAFVALLDTQSLGSQSMFGVVCIVAAWRWVGRLSVSVRVAARVLLGAALVVGLTQLSLIQAQVDEDPATYSVGEHFERSQERRIDIWRKAVDKIPRDPLGWGPGAVDALDLAGGPETHNDYLAYLVERGAIGLVGLLGFLVTLFRRFEPGGAARMFLAAVATGMWTREVLNFRHVWIGLAITAAADLWSRRSRAERAWVSPDRAAPAI